MKYSKWFVFLAVLFLVFTTACSSKDGSEKFSGPSDNELKNINDSGFPIVKDKIKLKFFAGQAPATNDNWNDVMIFNHYKKMTNIDIDWQMVPHDSISEKRNLALGGGTLPDAFHSAQIGAADLVKYGQQGVFLPLNDLIDKYAPNFKKILEVHCKIKCNS